MTKPLAIAGQIIPPGKVARLEIPVASLPTQTLLSLPVKVLHGRNPGPTIWLSAAIHGDEINGVEIIRRVVSQIFPSRLRGTVITVPIVNVFGFIEQSRYLPDRRDLNRSFPGSAKGSLASRLAHLFLKEIVQNCTHGIDLHTAALPRFNLPQIRANLTDPQTYGVAKAFNAPVMLNANTRDGSLREAASERGIPVLLYEGGEALRFDERSIQLGVTGILRVMNHLDMADFDLPQPLAESLEIQQSQWVRAGRSGIFRSLVSLGERVRQKQRLGVISDTFGEHNYTVKASKPGIVISQTQNPLVNQGDGIIHVAVMEN